MTTTRTIYRLTITYDRGPCAHWDFDTFEEMRDALPALKRLVTYRGHHARKITTEDIKLS